MFQPISVAEPASVAATPSTVKVTDLVFRKGDNDSTEALTKVMGESKQAKALQGRAQAALVSKAGKKQRDHGRPNRPSPDQSVAERVIDCSSRLDPFAALPNLVDNSQERLLRFYLFDYPRAQYGFNPALRPHPVHINFNISLRTPACFQVILARSALTQINLKSYGSEQQRRSLEQATLGYKIKAIQHIQHLSMQYNKGNSRETADSLLASIMSLGNLDRRAGAAGSANMHYAVIRRLLKSTGGPLNIINPSLRRVSLFFECMYGTSPNSYIWDSSDFSTLLQGLNTFLQETWEITQPSRGEEPAPKSAFHHTATLGHCYLGPDSTLYAILAKLPLNPFNASQQDQLNLVWQLTSIFMVAALVVDNRNNVPRLRTYMVNMHKALDEGPQRLTARDATTNVMWLLFQGIGSPFSSSTTSVWSPTDEKEHSERILRVAGWMFVCRYLTFTMRLTVRAWLLQFLTGSFNAEHENDEFHPLKLSLFDFSYAR